MKKVELASLVDAHRRNDPTQAFYYSRVSAERRYLWVSLPKVASVTTAVCLRQLDGIPHTDGAVWDDEEVPKLQDFATPEIVEMLTSRDWFRFCFVRNPYDRLFSAYKDKIARTDQEPWYRTVQDEIRQAYGYPMSNGNGIATIAFRDFVRYVTSGARRGDGHWCVQSIRLMADMIRYDFIGRFETLADDFRTVLTRLEAPDSVLAQASVVRGNTPKVALAAAYDRELASTVYEWYRSDFEAFGYDRDSWMFEG